MNQKRALITGASMGIGQAMAERLAHDGYAVTLVARSEDLLEKVKAALPGNNHTMLVFDLTKSTELTRLCDHMANTRYQLLVNNAGVGVFGPFTHTSYEKQEHMMELNILALTKLSYAFLKRAESGDALINVSSMVSYTSYPKSPVYAGTKGYVRLFSESLWYTEKKRGVYVMCLLPGITKTKWHEHAGGSPRTEYPSLLSQTAMQCADEAIDALYKRKDPVVITGNHNKLAAFLTRFASRSAVIATQGKYISDQISSK